MKVKTVKVDKDYFTKLVNSFARIVAMNPKGLYLKHLVGYIDLSNKEDIKYSILERSMKPKELAKLVPVYVLKVTGSLTSKVEFLEKFRKNITLELLQEKEMYATTKGYVLPKEKIKLWYKGCEIIKVDLHAASSKKVVEQFLKDLSYKLDTN